MPTLEQDAFMIDVLGFSPDQITTDAGQASIGSASTEPASGDPASSAPDSSDTDSSEDLSTGSGLAGDPLPPPVITCTDRGQGTFLINGSGFVAGDTVHVEVTPVQKTIFDHSAMDWPGKADASGVLVLMAQIFLHPGDVTVEAFSASNGIRSNKVALSQGADKPDPNDPLSPDEQATVSVTSGPIFKDVYDAALQGASGRFDNPQATAEFARDVGEEAVRTAADRNTEFAKQFTNLDVNDYKKFFNEAVQGVASGKEDARGVVAKSHQMALASLGVEGSEKERLDWMQVTLPHDMVPDCTVVHGKVHGPKQHVLCGKHGHILDNVLKKVIAYSVEDYKAGRIFLPPS